MTGDISLLFVDEACAAAHGSIFSTIKDVIAASEPQSAGVSFGKRSSQVHHLHLRMRLSIKSELAVR